MTKPTKPQLDQLERDTLFVVLYRNEAKALFVTDQFVDEQDENKRWLEGTVLTMHDPADFRLDSRITIQATILQHALEGRDKDLTASFSNGLHFLTLNAAERGQYFRQPTHKLTVRR